MVRCHITIEADDDVVVDVEKDYETEMESLIEVKNILESVIDKMKHST